MPATPFARPIRDASGISLPCVCFNIKSFDISRDVRAKTLPGIDPIAEVPKPLKIPGIPSLLKI
jgi:hypothetical protein